MNTIKIVIGSGGSYSTCNERALGSEWLNLANYKNWDEIAAALKTQDFRLDDTDKELFVQDIDGLPSNCENWDYISPKELFERSKRAASCIASICIPSSAPIWKYVLSMNLPNGWKSSEITGMTTSTSMKTMTGKITAENCLKTATGIWTTTLSTTLTLRSTEDRQA